MDQRTIITENTYVTNFNADGQANGVELMTDENKEKVRELHSLYGFKLPLWLRDNVRTKVK